MKNKQFSIIIPTLNEEDYIVDLIEDIEKQSLKPREIFVIDGGSKDNTKKLVKKYKKVTLLEAKPPVGLQRTVAGNKAQTEVLFFLDADTRIEDHFFEDCLNELSRKHLDLACPRYIPFKSTLAIQIIYFLFNIVFFAFQKISPSGAGSCIIVTKKVFEEMKGFNHQYTYDDIEFIRRVSRKYRFGLLEQNIYVSDRRFKKYGVLATTFQYMLLSVFFTVGLFKFANMINYQFGHFSKRDKRD